MSHQLMHLAQCARRLSAPALAPDFPTMRMAMFPASTHPVSTYPNTGWSTAQLGVVGEHGCVAASIDAKRNTPGRLEGGLT